MTGLEKLICKIENEYKAELAMFSNGLIWSILREARTLLAEEKAQKPVDDKGLLEDLKQTAFEYFEGSIPDFWEQLISRHTNKEKNHE